MEWWHLYAILAAAVAALTAGFVFIRKKVKKRMSDQQSMVDQHKVTTTILVLEKRKDKLDNANLPRSIIESIPKVYKIRKVPLVKAKIGPQIMDLMCDEKIFDKIPLRKTVKVDIAGIFIAGIKTGKK